MKLKKAPPYAFVLDELDPIHPVTRPMFGAVAIYRGEEIVLILREKEDFPFDNGVWLATTAERHEALRPEFPSMRSIALLTETNPRRTKNLPVTGWQNLPADAPDFEESVMRACALIRRGDPRIGKVPQRKRRAVRR